MIQQDLFGRPTAEDKRQARIRARDKYMPRICLLLGIEFVPMVEPLKLVVEHNRE